MAEQVTGDLGAGGDGDRERQERQSGLQGGEAEHALEVDRGEEDGADEDAGDAEHDGGARHEGADLPGVRRDQRLGGASFDEDEGGQQDRGDG